MDDGFTRTSVVPVNGPERGRRATLDRRRWVGWALLAVAIGVVGLLGFLGFTRYDEATGVSRSITTHLYLTVQLFMLSSGSVVGPVPWELELARVAAPVLAAYALLRLIATLFREQADRLSVRVRRGHTVVAGLGHKGSVAVAELLERGDRLVVIERDATARGIRMARALGATVIVGDAREAGTQAKAGVARASELTILCGDDATNIEVARAARGEAARRRSGTLHCVVDIESPDLARLLCVTELERYGQVPMRIDFVDVRGAAVRALVDAHPPARTEDGAMEAIAIAGNGWTARRLAVELARRSAVAGESAVSLTIIGAGPASLEPLRRDHPELAEFVDLNAATDPAALAAGPIPGIVYVAPDDDELAAAIALELRARLAGHPTRIVVALRERGGLGDLLDTAPAPVGSPSLVAFGLLEEACRPDVLLAGMTELLARAMHGAYIDEAAPALASDDPARQPWTNLPQVLRESNRDQAAHIVFKLTAVGRSVVPLTDWASARQPFSSAEVETMARLEHERWVAERRRNGWLPGPRDAVHRTTPYLVPWDELPEPVRDTDRLFVRRLPDLLASVGLQAIRRGELDVPVQGPPQAARVTAAIARPEAFR